MAVDVSRARAAVRAAGAPAPTVRPTSPRRRLRQATAARRSATSSSRSMGWTTATRTWPAPGLAVELARADQQAGRVGQGSVAQRPAVGRAGSGTGTHR